MQILDGKNLSLKENENLKNELYNYIQTPILAIISIGKNDSNDIYINNKRKACEQVGISLLHFHYDEDIEEKTIIKKIKELNKDNSINGIIVQLPIPKKYDVRKIINTIDPVKDVDALSDVSMGKLMSGNNEFIPCTPRGILELLDYYKIPLESKNVVVIGRSDLVGKPIALECLKRNATVTLCHSYTNNLKEYTKKADILIYL